MICCTGQAAASPLRSPITVPSPAAREGVCVPPGMSSTPQRARWRGIAGAACAAIAVCAALAAVPATAAAAAPVNDLFANATPLSGLPISATGTNVEATKEVGRTGPRRSGRAAPRCGGRGPRRRPATVTVSLCGSTSSTPCSACTPGATVVGADEARHERRRLRLSRAACQLPRHERRDLRGLPSTASTRPSRASRADRARRSRRPPRRRTTTSPLRRWSPSSPIGRIERRGERRGR